MQPIVNRVSKGRKAVKKIRIQATLIILAALAITIACAGCASSDQQGKGTSISSTKTADASSSMVAPATGSSIASSSNTTSSTQTEPEPVTQPEEQDRVILGDEQFDVYLPLLEGKRVALYSNHTGIVGDAISPETSVSGAPGADLVAFGSAPDGTPLTYGPHILDALIERGVNVVMGFGPEHGFRGTEDAGALVADAVDEATGVPIRSLYGASARPSNQDMERFDTLVVDMQDVGLRYYTYYLTMYHLMDACAAWGKEVIVLDRPNPNGFYVDGPILRDDCTSAVGELPLPVVHGMTWGELASMINGEGWLSSGANSCDLTVVPFKNYTHDTKTVLASRPSPNLKDMRAVYLYASTCFFENTAVSIGRGTTFPFEVYGSPYLDNGAYAFSFTPESIAGATNPPFLGEVCQGVDLRGESLENIWAEGVNMNYLVSAYHDMQQTHPEISFFGVPDDSGRYWIDLLAGTTEVKRQIEAGWPAEEIEASWAADVEQFKQQRAPYLLY